jgi:hypothetical protein
MNKFITSKDALTNPSAVPHAAGKNQGSFIGSQSERTRLKRSIIIKIYTSLKVRPLFKIMVKEPGAGVEP